MNKTFKIVLMVCVIVLVLAVSGSIIYYFAIFRPEIEIQKFELEKKELEQKLTEEALRKENLEECFKKAEDWKEEEIIRITVLRKKDGNRFSIDDMDFIWKMYQDKVDNCYKKYGK